MSDESEAACERLSKQLADSQNKTSEANRELAETRAVLADVLEAKGEGWLAQLVGRREELFRAMGAEERGCACVDSHPYSLRVHDRDCAKGELLRMIGGDVETQRQVDAAHEAALSGFTLAQMRDAFAPVNRIDAIQQSFNAGTRNAVRYGYRGGKK